MRRINLLIIVALATAMAIVAHAQVRQKAVKQVQVTTQTIASQPAGEAYVIDLTQKGTVYSIDADVDLSRVRVRAAGDVVSLGEIAKREKLSGKLVLGQPNDVLSKDLVMANTTPATGYTCDRLACKCQFYSDCRAMGDAGVCKSGTTICGLTSCSCWKGPLTVPTR